MAHIALRPFKYQAPDGKMKYAVPGEELKDAADWKNRDTLIRRQWITLSNGEVFHNRLYQLPKMEKEDIPAKKKEPVPAPVKDLTPRRDLTPIPMKKDPTPTYAVKETESIDTKIISQVTKVEAKGSRYTEDQLNGLLKIELQVICSEMGLDKNGSKSEMIAAILAAQG